MAYGSDPDKVRKALLEVAQSNPEVLSDSPPFVKFSGFGDSSLDFELLVWTRNPSRREVLISDINFAIDSAFRKYGVEIPFPQRDIHIRSSIPLEVLIGQLNDLVNKGGGGRGDRLARGADLRGVGKGIGSASP
ncbi:MAG: mechanosensitive ion channel family protein [bacterium]